MLIVINILCLYLAKIGVITYNDEMANTISDNGTVCYNSP